MKRVAVLVSCTLLLSVVGCTTPSGDAVRQGAAPPQSQERSIDQAVRELKARADDGDLDYLEDFAGNRATAAIVMRAIESTDVAGLYREYLVTSESTATIDGHSLGNFQVVLVHRDTGWQVKSVYPCW